MNVKDYSLKGYIYLKARAEGLKGGVVGTPIKGHMSASLLIWITRKPSMSVADWTYWATNTLNQTLLAR